MQFITITSIDTVIVAHAVSGIRSGKLVNRSGIEHVVTAGTNQGIGIGGELQAADHGDHVVAGVEVGNTQITGVNGGGDASHVVVNEDLNIAHGADDHIIQRGTGSAVDVNGQGAAGSGFGINHDFQRRGASGLVNYVVGQFDIPIHGIVGAGLQYDALQTGDIAQVGGGDIGLSLHDKSIADRVGIGAVVVKAQGHAAIERSLISDH